jgi:DNA-binding CsgD family transcriptional regulator
MFYVLVFGIIFFSLYKLQQRNFQKQKQKIEEEKKRLLYIHELERSKTESELVALKNQNLESEINFKNSELASSTMHLVKKGELLTKIREELSRLIKSIDNPVAINEIKKVLKSVGEDDKIDQEWETFAKHFDEVHSQFVVNLKEKYPALSANEVKLCIYLRMNLSSKEIAQLMSISVRGVEISRYRLRKKIGIRSEVNLFDHLISIGSKDNKNELPAID